MQCYLPNNEDQRSEGEREGGRMLVNTCTINRI